MNSDDKERLVALLHDAAHWCQGAEARNADGQAVTYSAADATAWDLTGAACHLFGMKRARTVFVQIDRHVHDRGVASGNRSRDEIAAMVALQTWNDAPQTTHSELMSRLQSLPVRALSVPAAASSEPDLPAGDTIVEGTE